MVPFQSLQKAATIIRQGGVVAFPTETYYGLAVDPFNEAALARLFRVKKRSGQKPILTLISCLDQLLELADHVPPCFAPLIKLWPAPLTLVFPARPALSARLTAGTGTVGVRISPHPLAQHFVEICGQPLTATSANLSGRAAATTAEQVAQQFGDSLDYILDGGKTPGGVASTLVGCKDERPVVLRAGAMAPDDLPCPLG